LCEWRNFVYSVLIVVVPTSLMAQASGGAILHTTGGVWLNGVSSPNSSAVLPNDIIQTQKDKQAKIDAEGSTATVQSDTIVQFEGEELVLDHGGLQVTTNRGMRVRVNCVTIVPVSLARTRYDVIDVDGKIRVTAYENDVRIHSREKANKKADSAGADVIVHAGENAEREERCGGAARVGDIVDAKAAILNNIWAKGIAGAAIVTGACIALCRGDDPISPYVP
jgi:ferric-dicitrate binding protein FerR (iron transport regulator)